MTSHKSILLLTCVAFSLLAGCKLHIGTQYFPVGPNFVLGAKASAELKLIHANGCNQDQTCTHDFVLNHYNNVDSGALKFALRRGASGFQNFYWALMNVDQNECFVIPNPNSGQQVFSTVPLNAPGCLERQTSIE